MKISGAVIQERNIKTYTDNDFDGTYKGKRIIATTDHGFGKPKYDHLKRFYIYVVDIKTGMYDVQTHEDFHTINDAIRYALKGSCLIS
jgi:hypothetical protein